MHQPVHDLDLDLTVLEDLDFDTMCDFGPSNDGNHTYIGPHDDPARWMLYKKHPCGHKVLLACERCKLIMWDAFGVVTCSVCGATEYTRDFWYRVERLNRTQ